MIRKAKAIWCPLRGFVCSRNEDEILFGRRGLCTIDTSTSGCPAREQGYDLIEIGVMVIDGAVLVNKKDAIDMLIRRMRMTLDDIQQLVEQMEDDSKLGDMEG